MPVPRTINSSTRKTPRNKLCAHHNNRAASKAVVYYISYVECLCDPNKTTGKLWESITIRIFRLEAKQWAQLSSANVQFLCSFNEMSVERQFMGSGHVRHDRDMGRSVRDSPWAEWERFEEWQSASKKHLSLYIPEAPFGYGPCAVGVEEGTTCAVGFPRAIPTEKGILRAKCLKYLVSTNCAQDEWIPRMTHPSHRQFSKGNLIVMQRTTAGQACWCVYCELGSLVKN